MQRPRGSSRRSRATRAAVPQAHHRFFPGGTRLCGSHATGGPSAGPEPYIGKYASTLSASTQLATGIYAHYLRAYLGVDYVMCLREVEGRKVAGSRGDLIFAEDQHLDEERKP